MMRRAGIHYSIHPAFHTLVHVAILETAPFVFLNWLKLSSIGLWQTLPMHPVGGGFHRTVPHLHLQVPHISSHWTGWLNRAF